MKASVSALSTKLVYISPSCWTIFYSFKIILKMGTVHGIGFEIQCSNPYKSIASKNIQSDMNYVSENT